MEPGHGHSDAHGHSVRPKILGRSRTACTACRLARRFCDRGVPCDRCTRMGLECVSTPETAEHRPSGVRKRTLAATGVRGEADAPAPPLDGLTATAGHRVPSLPTAADEGQVNPRCASTQRARGERGRSDILTVFPGPISDTSVPTSRARKPEGISVRPAVGVARAREGMGENVGGAQVSEQERLEEGGDATDLAADKKRCQKHYGEEDANAAEAVAALRTDNISCTSCRKAKRWCDKKFPCSRCSDLGFECVKQARGRGRPRRQNPLEEPTAQERPAAVDTAFSPQPEDQVATQRAMPTQTDWWEDGQAGEAAMWRAGGAAVAQGAGGGWAFQAPPPLAGVEPSVPPSPPVLPTAVVQLDTAPLGRPGEETRTGGASWPPVPMATHHSSVPWSGGEDPPNVSAEPPATTHLGRPPLGAEFSEPWYWAREQQQGVLLPAAAVVGQATVWAPAPHRDDGRPHTYTQGGEATHDEGEPLPPMSMQDSRGDAEGEGPGQAGEVRLMTRQVGCIDNLDLAYESCCRSMAQLSVGRKIDSARCRLLAQGLEFVFVVMGSGFASPTLLRVMKESASKAEDHEVAGAALLSMRYKKQRGDGSRGGDGGTLMVQAWPPHDASEGGQTHIRQPQGQGDLNRPSGPFWSVSIGSQSQVPTEAWTEEILRTPGAAGVKFVMVRPDTARSVQMVKTNDYMAEHFINETEFGMMGDQLKTMAPAVLARIVTPRSIPELFFIVAVNPAVLEEGSEHTCFAELINRRGEVVPVFVTVRRHFDHQTGIMACRFWSVSNMQPQHGLVAISTCERLSADISNGAVDQPPIQLNWEWGESDWGQHGDSLDDEDLKMLMEVLE